MTDGATFSICTKATTLNLLANAAKLNRAVSDSAFDSTGFSNWKKARDKCWSHEAFSLHSQSMGAISLFKYRPISSMISVATNKQQEVAKTVLNLLLRSIKYLGRQGFSLRSHSNRDGNLWQQMLGRTSSLPQAR